MRKIFLFSFALSLAAGLARASEKCVPPESVICTLYSTARSTCQGPIHRDCKLLCGVHLNTSVESIESYWWTVEEDCRHADAFRAGQAKLRSLAEQLKAAGVCRFIHDRSEI